MSEYKEGDKVVYEVKKVIRDGVYLLSGWKESEPLSTYTEPLEKKNQNKQKQIEKLVEKLHNQAGEIARLLDENKRLKVENGNSLWNIEQARAEGQNEAWELAKKLILYDCDELDKIFGTHYSYEIIMQMKHSVVAAKVAEWERQKEEIKVGDVLEDVASSNVKCVVTNMYPNNMAYLVFSDGSAGKHELEKMKRTGRHIDIDSFLKQIRGEE